MEQTQEQPQQKIVNIDVIEILKQNGALNASNENIANRYNDVNNKYITLLENTLSAATKEREQLQKTLFEFSNELNFQKKHHAEELLHLRKQIDQLRCADKAVSSLEESVGRRMDNLTNSIVTLLKLCTSVLSGNRKPQESH